MTVRKKSPKKSSQELIEAIGQFIFFLEGQKEYDAITDLRIAATDIEKYPIGSPEFKAAVNLIIEAYENEHELSAYTISSKDSGQNWSEAEELYLASTRVLNLAKRLI